MTILLLPDRKYLTTAPISTWLARGDRLPDQPAGVESLLRSVFEFDGPLAIAALTRQLDVGDAGEAQWLRADPAWVRADMMTARMFAHGDLGLSAPEIAALAPDLAALFAEHDLVFDAPTPNRWYLRCPDDRQLPAFADPADAIGDDLKLHLPQGPAGKRWRVLTNDIQILLHNHPVNERRVARGAAPVNSLWLWGGGRAPRSVRCRAERVISDEPTVLALAAAAQIRGESPASLATDSSVQAVVDLRQYRQEFPDSIRQWLDWQRHRQGGDITLNLIDGTRFHFRARHRWRYWRSEVSR